MVIKYIPAKRLKEGGTIGIFTPSEPITEERYTRLRDNARNLEKSGYQVRFAPSWRCANSYAAGKITERVDDIHSLLADPGVDLLMASWGGKSSIQLVPHLDYELLKTAKKPVSAFSDGCVFLNAITAKTGLITFYGPNVLGKLDESEFSDLSDFRTAGLRDGSIIKLQGQETDTIVPGVGEGILLGGNLSSFTISVIGSSTPCPSPECILAFESGPKTPQEFDLLVSTIRASALFSSIRGMVFGDVPIKQDTRWGPGNLSDILVSIFGDCTFPIIHAPVFGHRDLPNPILPIGCKVRPQYI